MDDGHVCPLCFDTQFSVVGGFMFCNSCGTQLEDFVEEQLEFEDTQITTKAHSTAVKRPRPEEERAVLYDLNASSQLYVACLQALLELQVNWVVEVWKLAPGLEGVVREIWRAYVLRSGLLEPQLEETPDPTSKEEGQPGQDTQQAEEEKFSFFTIDQPMADAKVEQKPRTMKDSSLHSILWAQCPPSATLEILFLGILIMREAIQPCDLIRAAARAELPFLSLPLVATPVLAGDPIGLPARVLRPRGIPTVNSLMDSSASLASLLALRIPQINSGALLHRYVAEMKLPKGLAEAALGVAQVHLMGSKQLCLRLYGRAVPGPGAAGLSHPYAHLMAALVLAARLAWGLDGRAASQVLPPPLDDLRNWALQMFREIQTPMRLPLSPHQAIGLTDAQLGAYLDYCKSPALCGSEPPEAIEKLSSFVKTARHSRETTSITQQAAGSEGCTIDAQAAGATSHPDLNARRYKSYDYTRYWGPGDTAAKAGLSGDYGAFLAVCARLIWVRAPDLHKLVVHLEKSCIQCESL